MFRKLVIKAMSHKALILLVLSLMAGMDVCFAAKVREVPADVGLVSIDSEAAMFPDGYKITKVTLLYKKKLEPSSVTVDDYEVQGQIIDSVEVNGTKVTINLDTSNVWYPEHPDFKYDNDRNTFGKYAVVTQKGDVTVADGKSVYTGPATITSEKNKEPKLFKQFWDKTYHDDETELEIRYALFTPERYSEGWSYPIVVFIPDSRATTNISKATLLQGMGGYIWATEEEQKKQQAFVVAIQYPKYTEKQYGPLVTGDGSWTPGLEAICRLIQKEFANSRASRTRVYGVGQGEGAAANLLIGQKYPSFYAAQVAISPIYEIKNLDALSTEKLWIMVSSKDRQSYDSMEKSLRPWIGDSVNLSKETWNVDLSSEEFENAALKQKNKGLPNNYTVIDGGCREYTWCIGTGIEQIRDWLMAQ